MDLILILWCWQGYQFWTQADTKGFFLINNIVPGDYNLYAWVPGFIGDYRYNVTITVPKGRIFFPDFLVGFRPKLVITCPTEQLLVWTSRRSDHIGFTCVCSTKKWTNHMGNWVPRSHGCRILCTRPLPYAHEQIIQRTAQWQVIQNSLLY